MSDTGSALPRPAVFALSLGGLILLWWGAARIGGDPTVLPTPGAVLAIARGEVAKGALQLHLMATLLRVAAAFAVAMVLGVAIGVALGSSAALNRWFGPWVVVFLNIPALVVIVLCYLWIGLNEVAAIVAVALNKTAMVAVNVREGIQALDRRVDEMARVFAMPRGARFRHVVLPQLWPYLAASTRNGLAIIWKIVLVVEFLGRSNGVGFQIHLYFQLFEVGYVLAYALSFVAVMLFIEAVPIRMLERKATVWRRIESGIAT